MSSLNPRLLIVGGTLNGGTADFDKIQDAIDAIGSSPRYPPATIDKRYTILVTPGTYREKITFTKSFVDLVGISQHSVHIQPETTENDIAIITLFTDVTVSNVTIWNHRNLYAIFGRDVFYAGLNRVEVWGRPVDRVRDVPVLSKAKALRMEGHWGVFITRFFGASYYGTDGHSVELVGPSQPPPPDWPKDDLRWHSFTDNGWNADCHLINSFFDSLSIGKPLSYQGGCVYVTNCHEVHIRNSLLRTTGDGSAVRIEAADPSIFVREVYPRALPYMKVGEKAPLVAVTLEGSTLNAPCRALSIGDFCVAFFRHSAADSIHVDTGVEHVRRGRLLDPGWEETRKLLELG